MRSKILATLLLGVMIFTATWQHEASATTQKKQTRILILPFTGTSAGDFGYLTETIRAMIASRLAAKDGIEIVDYTTPPQLPGTSDDAAIAATNTTLFSQYATDYIVSGALYAIQNRLKIQAVVSAKDQDRAIHLSALAENQSKILSTVDELVADIIARAMGNDNMTMPAGNIAATSGLAGFTTEHPEKIYKKKWSKGAIVGDALHIISHKVTKSSILPFGLVSMIVTDLDQDGVQEIIACSRTQLVIAHFNTTALQTIAEHNFAANYKIHAVNSADLNGDGFPEIYVSANSGQRVSSTIFSYTKGKLVQRAADIPWYLRPVEWPGQGLILAGQRGSRDPRDGFARPRVSQIEIIGDFEKLKATQHLPLPKNIHLFAFAWVQLDREGSPKLVAIDQQERLLVYNGAQQILWVSDEDFGGGKNYFGQPWTSLPGQGMKENDNSGAEINKIFIPSHIVAKDLDNDGDNELLLAKNTRLYGKLFPNIREYNGGTVACLDWQEDSFRELWETSRLQGYIADYGVLTEPASSTKPKQTRATFYVAQIHGKALLGVALTSNTTLYRYDITMKQPE